MQKGTPKAPFCCILVEMVGAARFELATPCTPCRYATGLRYAPTISGYHPHRQLANWLASPVIIQSITC